MKFTILISDWLVVTCPVFLSMVNGNGSDVFVLKKGPFPCSKPNSKSTFSSGIGCTPVMTAPMGVVSRIVQSRLTLIIGGGLSEAKKYELEYTPLHI